MLYSRKQPPINEERGEEGKPEAKDDSRSKSFSTLLYEDKVRCLCVCGFSPVDGYLFSNCIVNWNRGWYVPL